MKNLLAILILATVTLPASAQTIRKGSDGTATIFFKDGTSSKVWNMSNEVTSFVFSNSGSVSLNPQNTDIKLGSSPSHDWNISAGRWSCQMNFHGNSTSGQAAQYSLLFRLLDTTTLVNYWSQFVWIVNGSVSDFAYGSAQVLIDIDKPTTLALYGQNSNFAGARSAINFRLYAATFNCRKLHSY